jgi:hypothetical protein
MAGEFIIFTTYSGASNMVDADMAMRKSEFGMLRSQSATIWQSSLNGIKCKRISSQKCQMEKLYVGLIWLIERFAKFGNEI